jgi:hypothetical protein
LLNIIAGTLSVGVTPSTNSYESIATTTLSTTTATITFSSIPSTYTHLQVRVIGRTNRAGNIDDQIRYKLNSDAGSNYTFHQLAGNGTSASAYGQGAGVGIAGVVTGATASTNVFGISVIDVLDYANTNKYKTLRFLTGYDNNGSGQIILGSSAWLNTSAVTSITIEAIDSYIQYSSFALYGIKGA